MKIGILTYHRAENYGGLLQAYALKTYLLSLGHDVSFVDYWPKYHENYFKLFSWKTFRSRGFGRKVAYLLDMTLWLLPRWKRKHRLVKFMYDHLKLHESPQYNDQTHETEGYDIVFYGSDQIWRKQHLEGVGFDPWYFGSDKVKTDKRIVFSGSMGTLDTTENDDRFMQKSMCKFQRISVREIDLKLYLENLGISSIVTCDPVFLLSKDKWREIESKTGKADKYILFYNLLESHESKVFAERLSREKNLPIHEINRKPSLRRLGRRYSSTTSVESFLSLIDNAEYVISNSFHGVAFSLIFQKQFFAVGMGKKANRVVSLLANAGIPERYVEGGRVPNLVNSVIDYKGVHASLQNMIFQSEQYIQESILG